MLKIMEQMKMAEQLFARVGRKEILRKDAQANVARGFEPRVNVLSRSQRNGKKMKIGKMEKLLA